MMKGNKCDKAAANEKMLRCLFHIHTDCSKDSMLDKHSLLFMCKFCHIDVLAITDHDEVQNAIRWRSFFESHGVHVITGEEIFTSDGEIIGLYLKNRIVPGQSPEVTVAEIHAQGGIVYIPHPFDEKRVRSVLRPAAFQRILRDVDMVEVHNGRNAQSWYDEKQRMICEAAAAIPVIGADAHTWFEVGRNVVEVPVFSDKETLLKALRSPKCCFHPNRSLYSAHFVTKCVRILKLIAEGDLGEIQRIFHRKFA